MTDILDILESNEVIQEQFLVITTMQVLGNTELLKIYVNWLHIV